MTYASFADSEIRKYTTRVPDEVICGFNKCFSFQLNTSVHMIIYVTCLKGFEGPIIKI